MTIKRWLVLGCVLGIAACSQEVPNTPASPAETASPPTPATALPPAPAAPVDKLPAGAFTVELGQIDCTDSPVAVANVSWDAGKLAGEGVAVQVESPGNRRKLWLEGGAKGNETTGKWVFTGSRFILMNRMSSEILAQRLIPEIHCPAK